MSSYRHVSPANYIQSPRFYNEKTTNVSSVQTEGNNGTEVNALPSTSVTLIYVYITTEIISIIFLSVAIIVHFICPLRKFHYHVTVVAYLICVLLTYVGLFLRSIYNTEDSENLILCALLAEFLKYSRLAGFVWFVNLNYNVWKQFRDLKLLIRRVDNIKKIVIVQSVCGWGIPAVLAGFAKAMDNFTEVEIFQIDYWKYACYGFENIFFYVPVAICMTISLLLLLLTIWNINKLQNIIPSADFNFHKNLKNVTLKLFVVILIILGSQMHVWFYTKEERFNINWINALPSIINNFSGLYFFLILVCNPNMIRNLKKWYNNFRGKDTFDYNLSISRNATNNQAIFTVSNSSFIRLNSSLPTSPNIRIQYLPT